MDAYELHTKLLDFFTEAKEQGFTHKLEDIGLVLSDREPVLYGNFWGKDFRLVPSDDEEEIAAIRIVGALNSHKDEIQSLKNGQELKLARIGDISYSLEYLDDDCGYDEYFVTKENGVLIIKLVMHAPRWISSPVQTSAGTLDEVINSWLWADPKIYL